MMNLIITGTIGLDNIKTPFGETESALGGSGVYAACAASFFTKPGLVSIAGTDLPAENIDTLSSRGIDLSGVEYKGKNFRWTGSYEYDMNEAKTLKTELNSLTDFNPELPVAYKKAGFAFLGNTDTKIQLQVIEQIEGKSFIAIDTMNFWIQTKRNELLQVIKKANLVIMNEGEARQLFDTPNLIKAGKMMLELGPKFAIIKKGEHGALLFSEGNFFSAPGYPLENVCDPTGAGDSFAGGLMGYLASLTPGVEQKTPGVDPVEVKEPDMRKAVIFGSTIASFCAENFGASYLDTITIEKIEERYKAFEQIRKF